MIDQARLIVAMGLLVTAMILYPVLGIRAGRKQGENNKSTLKVNE